jgi:hypothetical protein
MGSGADVFLDRPEQEDEQGLRAAMCERGNVSICCHDSPHDEATRSCLRTVHTVSLSTRVNKAKKKGWSLRLPGSGPSGSIRLA